MVPLALAVCVASYLGVLGLCSWARRHQVYDIPNDRSSHTYPTPTGGGLVIVLGTLLGLCLLTVLSPEVLPSQAALAYCLGAVPIAAVSWLDDLRGLSYRFRLMVHILGAVVAMASFGYWERLEAPLVGPVTLGYVGWVATLVWVVGLTNAYNFMDGIDGIAASQAIIAAAGWALLGAFAGYPLVLCLGLLLAASSLGFLIHNWSPARIFMGDVGAAFLGYSFATLPLMLAAGASVKGATERAAGAGLLMVWPFVADATFTFVRRLLRRENVFAPHRSHLYQRLTLCGLDHGTVARAYAALGCLAAASAIWWYLDTLAAHQIVLATLVLQPLALWGAVRLCEARGRGARRLPRGAESGVLGGESAPVPPKSHYRIGGNGHGHPSSRSDEQRCKTKGSR